MSQTRRVAKSKSQMSLPFGGQKAEQADKPKLGKPALKKKRESLEEDVAPERPRVTAETMAAMQRDISVSEFFAKNRHLLGFDNKRKALLMTVKEAIDNSLDACEEAGHLPDLHVKLVQVDEERFRIIISDNGPGIVKEQIPNIFGKLLYGSKFHRLKMSRGQQGIGISAAGMYGMLTTGKSVKITSRTGARRDAHYYEIQIDTKKNMPQIVKDKTVEVDWPHGTKVEIELVGSFAKGKQSVGEYLEQTAIANPHARIRFTPPTGETIRYERGSETLPRHTEAIKPHPYGIELGVLIKMLHDTKAKRLSAFLHTEFSRVSSRVGATICEKAKLPPNARPTRIARQEAETLFNALQNTRIQAPPTNCLAPIGPQQILSGLLKGVRAEFFTAATREPAVYRGNPFQIEVGLAFGGDLGPAKGEDENDGRNVPQARVIRFANRVPLLYQQSGCCIFKSVVDTDWRRYGLSQPGGALPQGPVVIMVHMASVWVPFTSESKEAIADYDEITKEIKLGIQECGRKLNTYLKRRKKIQSEGERRQVFSRYIKEVASACAAIDPKINPGKLAKHLQLIAQEVTARADEDLDQSGNRIKPKALDDGLGENTVIVDRGEAIESAAETLFMEDRPGPRRFKKARKLNPKKKKRRRA
jgi:DNA topoisomerase-6 subunit B